MARNKGLRVIVVLNDDGTVRLGDTGIPLVSDSSPPTGTCCCNVCDNCTGGAGSVQIDVSGFASLGNCDNCEALNATWILDRGADADGCCMWEACDLTAIDVGGAWGSSAFCAHTFIFMKLCDLGDGTYEQQIQVQTWSNALTCRGDLLGSYFNTFPSKPTCADMEGTFAGTMGLPYCDSSAIQFVVTFT